MSQSNTKQSSTKKYQMQPASRIIDLCGGADVVASALGLTVATVHRWRWPTEAGGRDGRIPAKRQEDLLRWARTVRKPLKPEHFFAA